MIMLVFAMIVVNLLLSVIL